MSQAKKNDFFLFPLDLFTVKTFDLSCWNCVPRGKEHQGAVRSSKELHATSVNNPIISAMQYVSLTWLLLIISTVTSEFSTYFTTALSHTHTHKKQAAVKYMSAATSEVFEHNSVLSCLAQVACWGVLAVTFQATWEKANPTKCALDFSIWSEICPFHSSSRKTPFQILKGDRGVSVMV